MRFAYVCCDIIHEHHVRRRARAPVRFLTNDAGVKVLDYDA